MHIYVTGNSKIYVDLHIKCSLFLSDFSQISIFLTDFYRNPPYKMSEESVQWELC
jgi:hypothetical protein